MEEELVAPGVPLSMNVFDTHVRYGRTKAFLNEADITSKMTTEDWEIYRRTR